MPYRRPGIVEKTRAIRLIASIAICAIMILEFGGGGVEPSILRELGMEYAMREWMYANVRFYFGDVFVVGALASVVWSVSDLCRAKPDDRIVRGIDCA